MANNCWNTITFSGNDLTAIKQIIKETTNMNEGYLPSFVDISNLSYPKYLFDIYVVYDDDSIIRITCWTKWSPPTEELIQICRHLKINCSCLYEELGMGIFGRMEYDCTTDTDNDIYLTEEEISSVKYDHDTGLYSYDGELYESDTEIYSEMLESKTF